MAKCSIDQWNASLEAVRDVFREAAKKHSGPQVCWFRLGYHSEPTQDQVLRDGTAFLRTNGVDSAIGMDFLAVQGDAVQHYMTAFSGGDNEGRRQFQALASQAFWLSQSWPDHLLPLKLGEVAQGWCKMERVTAGHECVLWLLFACALRVRWPDPRLAIWHLSVGEDFGPIACPECRKDGIPHTLPIDQMLEFAPFDQREDESRRHVEVPVRAWGFVHDVWHVSATALDKIIHASRAPDVGKPKPKPRTLPADSPPERRITTNDLMLLTLDKMPEAAQWTITQWVASTGRGRATIQGTEQWKKLQAAHALAQVERKLKQESLRRLNKKGIDKRRQGRNID